MTGLGLAARGLRRSPGLAILAVATLALGIGASTAIYSALNAVVLRPLPYARPERLAIVWTDLRGASRAPASGPELVELRRRTRTLEGVAGVWVGTGAVTGGPEPVQIKVGYVTANLFPLLGVSPRLGRGFLPSEEGTGATRAIVLSDAFWRRSFGGDPGILGRAIRFEGSSCAVVGVMPPGFALLFPSDAGVPADVEAWVPFADDFPRLPRDLEFIRLVARLRPEATLAAARRETDAVGASLRKDFPEFAEQEARLRLSPLAGEAVAEVRPTLVALFLGVGALLAIACANVASLLLARGARRRREIAVRRALGASPFRIARGLFAESALLALVGGTAGVGVAAAGLRLLIALAPPGIPRIDSVRLDASSIGFALAASAGSALLFGLAPAAASARSRIADVLKREGGSRAAGAMRPRRWIVVAEVGLGVFLLAGAILLGRTLARLFRVDPGFRPDSVLMFDVTLPESRYPTDAKRGEFFRAAHRAIAALPGVRKVGASSHVPFDDYPNWYEYFWPDGAPPAERSRATADHRAVLPGYLGAIGATLVRGRDVDWRDDASHPPVAVVDDAVARRAWPGRDPIGKLVNVAVLRGGAFERVRAEVVGVVRPVKYESLTTDVRGQVYVPYLQSARNRMVFTVALGSDAAPVVAAIRREVGRIDPDIALSRVRWLGGNVERALSTARFAAAVALALAGLSLLLTVIGVYGVAAGAAAERTREIGIRMALGARPGAVAAMMLADGVRLVGAGVAWGVAATLAAAPVYSGLLYGVRPADPATLAAVAALLGGVGLGAGWVPARRAARIDPMTALREE